MLSLILALLLPLIIVLAAGPRLIAYLHKLKYGQTIYELGPKEHQKKQGTPTMGGLLFAAASCIVTLLIVIIGGKTVGTDEFAYAIVAVSLLNLLIGFVDDYSKVVKKRNLGLIWWQKIIGQVVVSAAFSWYCMRSDFVGTSIIVPFFNCEWNLGVFYIPLMTVFMIFMENSANLQDGVDGILSSITAVGTIAVAACALMLPARFGFSAEQAEQYRHLAIFALALCGGCFGFLRFNYHPAKVFMGDTGSMFIGGAMVGMAMLLRMPLFLLFFSFTPIVSSLSVIIQRTYYKLSHGKRIFKMSPIHHHFELSGMEETQIVAMYTVTEAVLCLIAVLSLL